MKHTGRAFQSALKVIFYTLLALIAVFICGLLAVVLGTFITTFSVVLVLVWVAFALFTLYFFRDPSPRVPAEPGVIVAPAHGKVDIIDEVEEPRFMGGPCRRISIFLSVFDVHVQNAPTAGKLVYSQYNTGQFINALKSESAEQNENLHLGFESSERPGAKLGVKLLAGVIARRIVPYIQVGDELPRGGRICLIQFGSRVNLYLPLGAKIRVKLNERVVGGHTVMASWD